MLCYYLFTEIDSNIYFSFPTTMSNLYYYTNIDGKKFPKKMSGFMTMSPERKATLLRRSKNAAMMCYMPSPITAFPKPERDVKSDSGIGGSSKQKHKAACKKTKRKDIAKSASVAKNGQKQQRLKNKSNHGSTAILLKYLKKPKKP